MKPSTLRYAAVILLVLTIATISVTNSTPVRAEVTESMKDRCSGDVFIAPVFDDSYVGQPGGVYLSRQEAEEGGYTPWVSMEFHGRRVRWFCHSQAGIWAYFDPGVWRMSGTVNTECNENGECQTTVNNLKVWTSDENGWFPERSRCEKRPNWLEARLGPDRLLQIRCIR